jgi:hypothetical protein
MNWIFSTLFWTGEDPIPKTSQKISNLPKYEALKITRHTMWLLSCSFGIDDRQHHQSPSSIRSNFFPVVLKLFERFE